MPCASLIGLIKLWVFLRESGSSKRGNAALPLHFVPKFRRSGSRELHRRHSSGTGWGKKKQQSLKSNLSTSLRDICFNIKPIISVIIAALTVTYNWCALCAHKTAGKEGALFFHSFPNLGKEPSTAAHSQHAWLATHPKLSLAKCFRKTKLKDPAPFIYNNTPDYNCDYMDWKYSYGWINEI